MKFEVFGKKNVEAVKSKEYQVGLEGALGASEIINKLEAGFGAFLDSEESIASVDEAEDPELRLLRLLKSYIGKDRERVKKITEGSSLYGFDCLTLSILICLLAHRKGYKVTIGRPKKLTRYLHALIVRSNGEMFKVAGRTTDYDIKEMSVSDVMLRLRATKPILKFANAVRGRSKK